MLVAIRCISVGEESKRGLKEDAGQKRPGEAFNSENNNILIVLGAGEKTKQKTQQIHRTEENKNSFEKMLL